jgi:ribonuclease Z
MEFTFLGTSSGTPTKSRNVSGLALSAKMSKPWYLVDCGEGTQHQILRTRYYLNNLKVIFITHIHGDHCYGLPGILAGASMAGRTAPLTIIGVGVETVHGSHTPSSAIDPCIALLSTSMCK